MSSVANWSYTATATIWRRIRDADGSDTDGGGQPYGWEAPIAILCDYQGGLSAKIGDLGREIVVKNTIWTEYETAREGDYILIGTSTDRLRRMRPMRFGRSSSSQIRSSDWRTISH